MKSNNGSQVEPVADLREAEGEINKEATTASVNDAVKLTSSVKERIELMERQKTMIVEKKLERKPSAKIVTTSLSEMLKKKYNEDPNSRSAKFLAKIGSLGKLRVKQNIIPEVTESTLRKSLTAKRISADLMRKATLKNKTTSPVLHSMPCDDDPYNNCPTPIVNAKDQSSPHPPYSAHRAHLSSLHSSDVLYFPPLAGSPSDHHMLHSLSPWTSNKCKMTDPVVNAELIDDPVNIKRINMNDALSLDLLKKVKLLKEVDDGCILLDENCTPVVHVPWFIDLLSLIIAKSCMEIDFNMKYKSLISTDTKENACLKLLAGEGLSNLGFGKLADSITSIGTNLSSGISLNIPSSVLSKIKEQELLLEKEKKSKEEQEVVKKKEAPAPKVVPISKKASSKKGPPPLKTKGPPPTPTKGAAKTKVGITKNVPDKSKVRRFFWDPIFGDDAKDTMFSKSSNLSAKVEKPLIEETFAKAIPKEKEVTIAKPKVYLCMIYPPLPSIQLIQLLPDAKRSYNMNIGLSKFNKYTFKELKEAVLNLDPLILTQDATESILLLIPTPEECTIVSEYIKEGGDLTMVDRPEQFVAVMIGIPVLRQRLECHQIALMFKDNFNEILNPLEMIMDGCEAIMSSNKLNALSQFILTIGNTLNEGDPKKGNAEGFKPTTYSKLNDFRTTTKPTKTLLQYICDIVAEEDETLLEIIQDLKCCDECSKIDINVVDERMNKFKNDMNKVKNAIAASEKTSREVNDQFPSIMNEFLRDAEPKVEYIVEHYNEIMSTYKDCVRYCGYTDKEVDKVKPNELFKYIWGFCQSVEQCRKIRIEQRLKQEKMLAAKLKKENASSGNVKKKENANIIASNNNTAVPKLLDDGMKNIIKQI